MIIGITGTNQAGKGVCGEYLRQRGFAYFSHSDEIRREAKKRGLDPSDRKVLQDIGNEMRRKHGNNYWTDLVIKKIRESGAENAVVDSCRNPGEVERLKKEDDFVLLAIDAYVQERYKRAIKNGRAPSHFKLNDFIAEEARENSSNPNSQQLGVLIGIADHVIYNNGNIEEFYGKIEEAIRKLGVILTSKV
ncbi:MAG: AAA family ATPase [Candidatus Woesearchaeota archaeon]